jgi:serine/threonine protein phosphatase PrpC
LILATDGFWDEFTSDEVAKFIEKNQKKDTNTFINLLLKESLSKAAESSKMSLYDLINLPENQKRKVYDDTTIIYYRF